MESDGATIKALQGNVGQEPDDPYLGVVLDGSYQVGDKLGKGGHGYVYEATRLSDGQQVAVKLLRPESLDDPELEGRFKHEGLVLCSLTNPHIITTYEVGQDAGGTMYIVMELLQGATLLEVMRRDAPMSWQRTLRILEQMCDALSAAHDRGILHRDLKPANIFVEPQPDGGEFIKVLDFGIAKILNGEPLGMDTIPKLTARGETIGTLRYMSPEQLLGAKLDGRSDIYTLGVVTYQMLTSQLPFPGVKHPAKLLSRQLRTDPEAPSTVIPGIPADVDNLVLRMLAKETELRFETTARIRSVCRRILGPTTDHDASQDDPENAVTLKNPKPDRQAMAAFAASGFGPMPGYMESGDDGPTSQVGHGPQDVGTQLVQVPSAPVQGLQVQSRTHLVLLAVAVAALIAAVVAAAVL